MNENMIQRRSASLRRAAGPLLAIAPIALASPAHAQFRDWASGSGEWTDPFRWSPFGPPAEVETARLGFSPLASNAFVDLNTSDTIAGLQINDGMVLDTNGFRLVVNGDTVVSDRNEPPGPVVWTSRLRVANGIALTDFRTHNLVITNGARVESSGSPIMQINGTLSTNTDTAFRGNGSLNFDSDTGPAIVNNGMISAYGGTLVLNQLGDARFDLDGVLGQGRLWMNTFDNNTMIVNGTELTDDFSGVIFLVSGTSLYMNLDNGWVADASSTIDMAGGASGQTEPGLIAGSDLTIGGLVKVRGFQGRLNVASSSVTIQSSATFDVAGDDSIYFQTQTTVEGGDFIGGRIVFEGPTRLEGGTFSTPSISSTDGQIYFGGATTYVGEIVISGNATQHGDATVLSTSSITADVFDMDGGGTTVWNINAPLTVTAGAIDDFGGSFAGEFHIGSNFLAALTVILDGPAENWNMAGEISLIGNELGYISRLNGSPVVIDGIVRLPSARAQINADAHFRDGSVIDLTGESASLRMSGVTTVMPGVAFSGVGSFRNGPAGEMTIESTANLQQVGLVNQGLLHIDGPGYVFVDRFENTETGTLVLELAGTLPGVSSDLLITTDGPATLAGTLDLRLYGDGAAQYTPEVGNSFIVLASHDGIVGTFDSVPDTLAGGDLYEWSVTYGTNNVTVELIGIQDNIAPCSLADFAQPWGTLDLNDVTAFVDAFTSQDPSADIGAPYGFWGLEDLIAFIVAFQAGCP